METQPEAPVDPTRTLHPLRRPAAVIGLGGLAYLVSTAPIAAVLAEESWYRPLQALVVWVAVLALSGLPLVAGLTVLAARAERALTGLRQGQRSGWAGVALGVVLFLHWLPLCVWWMAVWGQFLTGASPRGSLFEAGLLLTVAPVGLAFGAGLARWTGRRLRRRDWSDVLEGQRIRRFPRVPTPWLGGGTWLVATGPAALLWGAVIADEAEAWIGAAVWAGLGVVAASLAGAYGAWLYRGGPDGDGTRASRHRWLRGGGVVWTAHWLPFFAISLLEPLWGRSHHGEQLTAALLASVALVLGTAMASYGTHFLGQRVTAS